MTKKRNLITALVLFSIVLCVGIVYAATAGLLTFTGSATLSENVRLDIVSASAATSPGTSLEATAGISVSGDKQTATLTANLEYPGDKATYTFSVQNTGSVDAEITGMTLTPVSGTGSSYVTLGGNYATLDGEEIYVSTTEGPYTITLEWTGNSGGVGKEVEYEIKFTYAAL